MQATRSLSTTATRPIRLLVFTSLYPNAVQRRHGIFVEERLRHLVASGRVTATVVAPVPWFPFRSRHFGRYGTFARVPRTEQRHGIRVLHPRYPVIPKLGMRAAPALLYRALRPVVRRLLREEPGYDLMDAHYLYPDGVAAVALGKCFGLPVVVTARGNDVTLFPRYRAPRRKVLATAADAAAVATVAQALRARLVALGAEPARIEVLRNGVDLEAFRPVATDGLRATLNVNPPVWLTVGHLIERKGVRFVIEALAEIPKVTLLVIGDGPREADLRLLAERLDVAHRVRFLGAVAHEQLCCYYSLVDVMLLASSREGMPNVALESLACGTPVVAAPFEGVEEVLQVPEAGEIAHARTGAAMAAAWRRLQARRPSRASTRRFAEQFLGWQPVIEAQIAWYSRICAMSRPMQEESSS